MCVDFSFAIFIKLEQKKIEIIIKSKYKGTIEQRVVIAYVDDAVFCTSGEYSEIKMQEIMSYCMTMHEATCGRVQRYKVSVCFLKWIDENIIHESIEIKLKDELIKQLHVNNIVKTLGVYVNPVLDWND